MKMKIMELQVKYKSAGTCEMIDSITTPAQMVSYLRNAFDHRIDQEQLWIILLNGANRPIARHMCTMGIVNSCNVHPRETFRFAIREGAVGIVVAHNHPSGSVLPSKEDLGITRRLVEVGRVVDIPVLDHIIMAGSQWTSIKCRNPELFN